MILRPVSPQSPIGPPITKRPVGLTRKFLRSLLLVVEVARQHRVARRAPSRSGLDQRLGVDAVGVLGGDQDLLDLDRLAVLVADASPGSCRRGAGRGARSPLRTSARRLASRCASEIGSGISSSVSLRGVAEHHPLVAGAGDVELVLVGGVGARLVGRVDALGDVGRLLVDRVDAPRRCRSRSRRSASV